MMKVHLLGDLLSVDFFQSFRFCSAWCRTFWGNEASQRSWIISSDILSPSPLLSSVMKNPIKFGKKIVTKVFCTFDCQLYLLCVLRFQPWYQHFLGNINGEWNLLATVYLQWWKRIEFQKMFCVGLSSVRLFVLKLYLYLQWWNDKKLCRFSEILLFVNHSIICFQSLDFSPKMNTSLVEMSFSPPWYNHARSQSYNLLKYPCQCATLIIPALKWLSLYLAVD